MGAIQVRPFVLCAQAGSASSAVAATSPADSARLVVLVHGMGRTSLSMLPLKLSLERAGYRVLNFNYSSYGPSIEKIGRTLSRRIGRELKEHPAAEVHFVGHSLGNIVLRWVLANEPPTAAIGRFVMLAPPNRGSRTADRLEPYLRWLLAPIPELRTASSTVMELPAPTGVEFAIIAGRWDDKVSLPETCLPGAKAHRIVPSGHTFIMMRADVERMIRQFLATGRMPEGDSPEAPPCVDGRP